MPLYLLMNCKYAKRKLFKVYIYIYILVDLVHFVGVKRDRLNYTQYNFL